MLHREGIQRKAVKKPKRHLEVLPLDPRDPDIVRAKRPTGPQPPRRRAA
jgi:hypothetical protein